jgi:hypothetical protein
VTFDCHFSCEPRAKRALARKTLALLSFSDRQGAGGLRRARHEWAGAVNFAGLFTGR